MKRRMDRLDDLLLDDLDHDLTDVRKHRRMQRGIVERERWHLKTQEFN